MALQWLPVNEAAKVLDVSEDTVRRRAKRGMLDSRQAKHHGGRLEVRVPVKARSSTVATARKASTATVTATEKRATTPAAATTAQTPADEKQSTPQATADTTQDSPAEAAQLSDKFGRYSALPASWVGGRPEGRFTPSDLMKNGTDAAEQEDEVTRYQRLAGASVILAQRQADAACEQVAMARGEVHRLRRVCFVSWAAGAVAMSVCLMLALVFGVRSSNAHAELAIQQQRVTEARSEVQRLANSLQLVQRQLGESGTAEQTSETGFPDPYAIPFHSTTVRSAGE